MDNEPLNGVFVFVHESRNFETTSQRQGIGRGKKRKREGRGLKKVATGKKNLGIGRVHAAGGKMFQQKKPGKRRGEGRPGRNRDTKGRGGPTNELQSELGFDHWKKEKTGPHAPGEKR